MKPLTRSLPLAVICLAFKAIIVPYALLFFFCLYPDWFLKTFNIHGENRSAQETRQTALQSSSSYIVMEG
jgi:hypothetical protein